MMRLLACILFLLPSVLFAQVSVRTGDHPTFSRLVITIPAGTTWEVDRVGGVATIRFAGTNSISLDGFFDRIQRSRITSAEVAGSSIRMLLNCDCGIDAFLWQPDKIVLDVTDPEAGDLPVQSGSDTSGGPSLLPLIPVLEDQSTVWPSIRALAQRTQEDLEPIVDIQAQTAQSDERTQIIQAALMEDLARAAAKGLVTLPDLDPASSNATAGELAVELRNALAEIAGTPGVTFRTSADVETSEQQQTEPPGPDPCAIGARYAVGSWGTEKSFAEQISEKRLALVADLDGSRKPDVDALARTYLYFGFGREAIDTLKTDGFMDQDRIALIQIGQIIDDQPLIFRSASELMGCDTEVALWAFLASDEIGTPDRNAILQSFRELAPALQVHLGPRLSQRFVAAGDPDAAELALNPNNSDPDGTIEGDIARIDVLSESPNTRQNEIESHLEQLSSEPERLTPSALVALMRSNRTNNLVSDAELMDLAQIMRFESRDKPIATELGIEELRSAAISGDISRALSVRDALALPDELRADIDNEIGRHAIDQLGDIAFLDLVVNDSLSVTDADLENRFATRLLDLGFPDIAGSYLTSPAIGPAMMERRYLRAQTALASGAYDRIDPILAGITTPRAVALRNESLARQAGYTTLAAESNGVASDGQSDVSAWRDGDWQRLAAADDPLFSTAADLQLTDVAGPASDALPPLAGAYDLLERSTQLQDFLTELSDRYVTPE